MRFNRTIVELKRPFASLLIVLRLRFNRTIVELKPVLFLSTNALQARFNRTIVELKRLRCRQFGVVVGDLIEPLWN